MKQCGDAEASELIELFSSYENTSQKYTRNISETGQILRNTFEEFGVKVKCVSINKNGTGNYTGNYSNYNLYLKKKKPKTLLKYNMVS